MKKLLVVASALGLMASCSSDMNSRKTTSWSYPVTAKVEHTETLHDVAVSDRYRWLEDNHAADKFAFLVRELEMKPAL